MSAVYDYLRAVAIVVAFIAAKQSKKAAWSFDLFLTAWFGMGCFLFPKIIVSKVSMHILIYFVHVLNMSKQPEKII
jgi:hypothetical protein